MYKAPPGGYTSRELLLWRGGPSVKLLASCAGDTTFLSHHSCCGSFGMLKLGFESPILL